MTLEATHRGAGIVFKTKDGRALFLKRGPGGDYPGYWCFPGGHVEEGESAEDAAKREAVEEIGSLPKGKREVLARSIMVQELPAPVGAADGAVGAVALPPPAAPEAVKVVDYTTFAQDVGEPFEPEGDKEHVGHAWSPLSSPPEPLHPGCRVAIDRLHADELGVARMMRDGALTSPQVYANVTLWLMRVTGTGVSYRAPVIKRDKDGQAVLGEDGKAVVEREEEFPWRDPAIYLNDEFLARCNGLPVVWKHPKGATLNSKEFEDRAVGTVFLPFIRGEEVWCVAKVFDADANAAMRRGTEDGKDWSTSPAVVLSDPNNPSYKFRLEDGSLLLVEGKPSLLDHLAICERGVWDKGGEPAGIINDSLEGGEDSMSKKDVTLEDVLAAVGQIGQRVTDLGTRMDAFEKDDKKDAAVKDPHDSGGRKDGEMKCDADKDKDGDDKKDSSKKDGETTPPASREDSSKKDSDKEDDKDGDDKKDSSKKDGDDEDAAEKVAADAKADAAAARAETAKVTQRLAALEARMPTDRSDSDHRDMSAAQARADAVYGLFGKQAPRFLNGENIGEYRRRLVREFVGHSPEWKAVDVGALPDAAFEVAEGRIYADAAVAAKNADGVEEGGLRMVHGNTPGGHKTIEYYGRPGAWMGRFGGAKRIARITPNTKREAMN